MKKFCLYIFCGFPFSGKTTLSRIFARKLGINRVAIDDINTERGIWDDETGLSPEEWANTYNEAYQRIEACLHQGESVIDDSANFTMELRDRLRSIAARYDAQTMVIFVDTPLADVRRRWLENRQTGDRADVRDSDFLQVIEQFAYPTDAENVLRYDGSISAEEWIALNFSLL